MDKIKLSCSIYHFYWLFELLFLKNEIEKNNEELAISQIKLKKLLRNCHIVFNETFEVINANKISFAGLREFFMAFNVTKPTFGNKEITNCHLYLNNNSEVANREDSKKSGFLHVNFKKLYENATLYFLDEEIEVSPDSSKNQFLGWNKISSFKNFCNSSLVVCDNYYLNNVFYENKNNQEKSKTKDSIDKNLTELIESIIISNSSKKSVCFYQYYEKEIEKRDEKGNKILNVKGEPLKEKIKRIINKLQLDKLKKKLNENNKNLMFGIYDLDKRDKLHDRDIYTNYLSISCGNSIDFYDNNLKIEESKTTKIRIRSIFNACKGLEMNTSTFVYNKTQKQLQHLKKGISKLPPSDFSESANMITPKHNPLFDFYCV